MRENGDRPSADLQARIAADATQPAPAEVPLPIDAATVVVMRDGADGGPPEVLMLRRNSRGFFGGMWVFPGGRVEDVDRRNAAPGDVVPDCEPPHGSGALCLGVVDEAGPDAAVSRRGFFAAAVREAHEEAGRAPPVVATVRS